MPQGRPGRPLGGAARACCYAAYDVRSVIELSGRTAGRLGDIRPDTAHSIKGTAELALRHSIIPAFAAGPKQHSVMTNGRQGAAGAWSTPPHPPGPQDRLRDYGPAGSNRRRRRAAGAEGPSRDYGPAGSSGCLRRLRRDSSTFRGTTSGRTETPTDYAGVHSGTRTTRPRDHSGAGRRVSPMHEIRS